MGNYLGLVELVLTALAVGAFGVWQLRSLKRDMKARKARDDENARKKKNARLSCRHSAGRKDRPLRRGMRNGSIILTSGRAKRSPENVSCIAVTGSPQIRLSTMALV